jgi:hypothetical protein
MEWQAWALEALPYWDRLVLLLASFLLFAAQYETSSSHQHTND